MKNSIRRRIQVALFGSALLLMLPLLMSQDALTRCKPLSPDLTLKMVPDRAPMESDAIMVDTKTAVGLEFSDKTRLVLAAFNTSGLPGATRQRYQYLLVTETRIKADRGQLPAGMMGLELEKPEAPETEALTLIVRDCFGSQIEKITMKLDPSTPSSSLALIPKGVREFELRLGKYVAQMSQR